MIITNFYVFWHRVLDSLKMALMCQNM